MQCCQQRQHWMSCCSLVTILSLKMLNSKIVIQTFFSPSNSLDMSPEENDLNLHNILTIVTTKVTQHLPGFILRTRMLIYSKLCNLFGHLRSIKIQTVCTNDRLVNTQSELRKLFIEGGLMSS